MDKDHLVDLEALRDEVVEFIRGANEFDDIDMFKSNYQDSDDINSPPSSEKDEDGNNKGGKGKKEKGNDITIIICIMDVV